MSEHSPLTRKLIADGLRPAPMPSDPTRYRYGEWLISYDPPPIPVRTCDWHFWHQDYDGAEDSKDGRCGHAASLEACIAEITDYEAEERAA